MLFFSIIVPVYNVEKYLDECIQSVLSQSFPSYELILVDDGSTDSSGKICDKYYEKYKGTVHVIHKDNHGLSSARNAGLQRTVGKYVIFLDSDDILLDKTVLQTIHDNIHGQDMLAFEWKEFISGQDVKEVNSKISLQNICSKESISSQEYLTKMLRIHAGMPWYACMYVYKYTYIQANHLTFTEGRLYEDVLFTPNALLEAQNIGVISYPVYGYRIKRPGSTTSTIKLSTLQDMLYAAEHNIQMARENNQITTYLQESLCSNYAMLYFSVMINVYALQKKSEQKIILTDLKRCRWIADYAHGKKQIGARRLMNVIGFMPTVWLLNLRRKIREGN